MPEPFLCPACGKPDGVPVLRGMPDGPAWDAERQGLIVSGGCVITEDMRNTVCRACSHAWDLPSRAISRYLDAVFARGSA